MKTILFFILFFPLSISSYASEHFFQTPYDNLEFKISKGPCIATIDPIHFASENLESYLESGVGATIEEKMDLIANLNSADLFPILIGYLLKSPELLADIAKHSYYHANGFDKLVLFQKHDYSLRLHIWWQENKKTMREDIHNHRWDFVSSILVGSSRQEFFTISGKEEPDAFSINHYPYTPNQNSAFERYQMADLGKVFLKKITNIEIPQGITYSLHQKELHRVICDYKDTTATLVFYTRPYEKHSEVYSEHKAKDSFFIERFSVEEIIQKLDTILNIYFLKRVGKKDQMLFFKK